MSIIVSNFNKLTKKAPFEGQDYGVVVLRVDFESCWVVLWDSSVG